MSARPDPYRSLTKKIRELEARLNRLSNSSPFSRSGMVVTSEGETEVTGNLPVTGDFTADGKIRNAALTDPVVPYVAHAQTNTFARSTGAPAMAPITGPVPPGYSRALVTCIVVGNGYNTTGASGFMSVFAVIEGDPDIGFASQCTGEPGGLGTASQTSTALLTGVSGSIQVHGVVRCQSGTWPAEPASGCNADVTVAFLR